MHRVPIFLGCAILFLASSPMLKAATDGPHTTSTPISLTTTDWGSSLDFPKFDSSLGTLTQVELDLNGHLETTITVTNSAASASSGTAQTEVQFTVQDGGSNLIVPELDLLSSPAYSYSLAPGGSSTSGLITKNGSSSDMYSLPAVLAEFNGPGTITLSASTFTQTLLANTGGNTAADQVTSASLTGSVIYTYTPVPEPGTLVLLGIAVAGLFGFRRLQAK